MKNKKENSTLLQIKDLKIEGFSDERWHKIIKGVNLELKWSPEDKPGTSWEVIVDCPHEKFTILEDGKVYCIGVVIHKDDLNL